MWYELWDSETGNRVGKYPTEEEALRAILDDVQRYGADSAAVVTLGLLRRDPAQRQDELLAEGTALVGRALALADVAGNPIAGVLAGREQGGQNS